MDSNSAEHEQACSGQHPTDCGLTHSNATGNARLQHATTPQLNNQQGLGWISGSVERGERMGHKKALAKSSVPPTKWRLRKH